MCTIIVCSTERLYVCTLIVCCTKAFPFPVCVYNYRLLNKNISVSCLCVQLSSALISQKVIDPYDLITRDYGIVRWLLWAKVVRRIVTKETIPQKQTLLYAVLQND